MLNFKEQLIGKICAVASIAVLVSVATPANANPALTSITGGFAVTSGSDQLYGWIFTVNSAVNVSALGVYDANHDGMAVSHDIGIYRRTDQSLVASTTLGTGLSGFLDGDFRYNALGSDILLASGDYEILMTMPQFNDDRQLINVSAFTTAPEVTWTNSAFDSGSSLHYVSAFGGFAPGMFGPNFEFSSASVPEPASLALLSLGLAGLGISRRRKA